MGLDENMFYSIISYTTNTKGYNKEMTQEEKLSEMLFRAKILIGTVANVMEVMPVIHAGVLAHAATNLANAVESYTEESLKDGVNLGDMAMRDMFVWLRDDPDTPEMFKVIWSRMADSYPQEQPVKLDKIWENWGDETIETPPPAKSDGKGGVAGVDKLDGSGTEGTG